VDRVNVPMLYKMEVNSWNCYKLLMVYISYSPSYTANRRCNFAAFISVAAKWHRITPTL